VRIIQVKYWETSLLWPPYVIGHAIIFLPCGFFLLLLSIFFSRLIPAIGDWMSTIYFHTRFGLSANLECMSEMWSTRLAENTGQNNRHFCTIAQFCQPVSSQLRHVSTIGKKLVKHRYTSSTCPHNMVNFGLLKAEICWRVWGTPAYCNGFRVLAVHGTLVVGVSQIAALNRGRHLYSAGRPSRWSLAHISSLLFFPRLILAVAHGVALVRI